MLVDPVLEHVEDPELDWLGVLLPEPFQILKGQTKLGITIRVADPDPNPDPVLFGRIRIRKIFTGSGSYRYFGNVKLYKQGKNILKIEVSHIFR